MAIGLRARTGLVFVTALAFQVLTLTAVASWYGISRGDREKFVTDLTPALEASRKMNVDAYEMLGREFIYLKDASQPNAPLLERENSPRNRAVKVFDQHRDDFEAAYHLASSLPRSPREQALLEEIQTRYTKAIAAHKRLNELIASGRFHEASLYHRSDAGPALFHLREAVDELYLAYEGQITAINANGIRNLDRMIVMCLLINLGGALATLALWLRASRQLVEPLLDLQAATTAIANGSFVGAHSPRAEDTTELAALQANFNLMSARLGQQHLELAANEQAARVEARTLREVDRHKTDFVNAVSHDLRGPLTSILGYAELLEDSLASAPPQEQAAFVQQIQVGAQRMAFMLDDFLDIARMEAGTFRLNVEPGDLASTIRELAESFRPVLQERGIGLSLDLPATPLVAAFDDRRIGQVLTNLLGNAVKFTPSGAAIQVRAYAGPQAVHCEVVDQGPGIEPGDLDKLFKRFSQLEAGRQKLGGMGLGLSISKAIVEAHGGGLGVESVVGEGSRFHFTLPLSRQSLATAHASEGGRADGQPG